MDVDLKGDRAFKEEPLDADDLDSNKLDSIIDTSLTVKSEVGDDNNDDGDDNDGDEVNDGDDDDDDDDVKSQYPFFFDNICIEKNYSFFQTTSTTKAKNAILLNRSLKHGRRLQG